VKSLPTGGPARFARAILTIALVPLGMKAFSSWDESAGVPLVGGINLAIHEFGHYLFLPFGEMMNILGGSLTEVAFPLVFAGYFWFSKEHEDRHAAMVCVWWSAIALASVAIYANDARAGQLMLITGQTGAESDGHDFENLFRMWGVLEKDQIYARRIRGFAGFMIFVSTFVGLYAALLPRKKPATIDA
jgi:hypothetical protein